MSDLAEWVDRMIGGPLYYDRLGRPLTIKEYIAIRGETMEYQRVVETTLKTGGAWVSTVWLGIDHSIWGGLPLIFETMAFRDAESLLDLGYMDRYPTEQDARRGHERIVDQVAQEWWLTLGGRAV